MKVHFYQRRMTKIAEGLESRIQGGNLPKNTKEKFIEIAKELRRASEEKGCHTEHKK